MYFQNKSIISEEPEEMIDTIEPSPSKSKGYRKDKIKEDKKGNSSNDHDMQPVGKTRTDKS